MYAVPVKTGADGEDFAAESAMNMAEDILRVKSHVVLNVATPKVMKQVTSLSLA